MINYLPPDQRKQLRAARTNVLLVRYNIGLVFAASFLTIAILAIFLLLTNEKQAAENEIATNQASVSDFSAVQAQADLFRQELANAKTLFDSQISYSKIYLMISSKTPPGAVLEPLTLDPSKIGTPMSLSFRIKGETQARNVLNSFQSSSMFSNTASYESLSANTGEDSGEYPYVITISVTINKSEVQ